MTRSFPTLDTQGASRVCCYQLDPTKDPRWAELVEGHPSASVFHTVGWLEALKRTYGYEPIAFTTSSPTSALRNGLVFCRVRSWLTGSRLVSLPFSDHCEPLCDSFEELAFLVRYLQSTLEHEDWKYLEVRSTSGNVDETSEENELQRPFRYFTHVLDLRGGLDDVLSNLHSDSIQHCVRRAERAGLVESVGRSEVLLKEFYDLFLATRRTHQLPPIPYAWFHNLVQCQDQAAEIRVAHQHAQPIAAILTLRFRNVLYYKYGCSDLRFHNADAIPWLVWNAIAAAKATGATSFDMGRTREDQTTVLAFKNCWVKQPRQLVCWSFPRAPVIDSVDGWRLNLVKKIFSHIPERLLALAGRIVYRHIG